MSPAFQSGKEVANPPCVASLMVLSSEMIARNEVTSATVESRSSSNLWTQATTSAEGELIWNVFASALGRSVARFSTCSNKLYDLNSNTSCLIEL